MTNLPQHSASYDCTVQIILESNSRMNLLHLGQAKLVALEHEVWHGFITMDNQHGCDTCHTADT